MSSQPNQYVFRRVIESGFNQGDYEALDALFAPGYKEHQFGLQKNLDGLKRDIESLRTAFPDIRLVIDDIVADGDKVWARITATGTHSGPFFGPPTGKRMTITVMDVCRFEDGRIIEHWGSPDRFALLAQLGLLPVAES